MPRTFGVCVLLGGALCLLAPTISADDARPPANSATVRALVDELPGTSDEWESRKTQVRQRLKDRLDSRNASAGAETHLVDRTRRDGSFVETVRCNAGRQQATWLVLVPAAHVGRGPAVACFVDDQRSSRDAEELVGAGYVVLVIHDRRTDRDSLEYLVGRRDVDPERVAVWGGDGAWCRAWAVAALDDRVAAVVSMGGIQGNDVSGAGDNELPARALLALIAPRPHWYLDVQNLGANSTGLQQALEFSAGLYRLYDLPTLFRVQPAKTKQPDARREALRWLREEL